MNEWTEKTSSTIISATANTNQVAERVDALDWRQISQDLDAHGNSMIENLISPIDCDALANLYGEEGFRSRVVMEQHGFGRGEYKYLSYPLPDIIARLRTTIYPHLVPVYMYLY